MNNDREMPLDLVGEPFAVVESDPGVFTSLVRKLGIRGIELVEVYGIEPWALDHLKPHGLIFCFLWHKDTHRAADFDDPAADTVWFANQLSDDACATHAILNVVLNCPGIDIGEDLARFKQETEQMSPVMRGLAVTNVSLFRRAHNSLARPADLRGAVNALAINTLDLEKKKEKEKRKESTKPPPAKKRKADDSKETKKEKPAASPEQEAEQSYHFIGYVPASGKVWELDGFKSGPLEVGELPTLSSSSQSADHSAETRNLWMDVVRPALRLKMDKYGGSGDDGSNIRFSLLAIVDDGYQTASDDLEYLKREKTSIEKRFDAGWDKQVDMSLWTTATGSDRNSLLSGSNAPCTAGFASKRMKRDMEILKMPQQELIDAWEDCVRNIKKAMTSIEDEMSKGLNANTEHINRTFDYEPFFKSFVTSLHSEGLLNGLLNLDENGRKRRATGSVKKGHNNG
ncbi:ubiquitin C-terminal hydrolase [Coprinopsis marcescibilis]|uniref:ubiquitinyl hydrolase 1 n=1 Tax=Coprinopsis marcescibilis TaxID=230819 RepID=A0A5C3KZL5_COPMA|nr:ubiquitin C-terminal hydrolase [Coprinopsis marcescibilis]